MLVEIQEKIIFHTSRRAVELIRSVVTVNEAVATMLAIDAHTVFAFEMTKLAC